MFLPLWTSSNADRALSCLQRSSDPDCPCVTVVGRSLSHADRTSRLQAPGSRPLRPELAAPLGVWPSSQLARCADSRASWRLSGATAVHDCCTAPASPAHATGAVLTRFSPFRRGIGRVGARCASVLAVSLVADAGRRLLALLSPLLSVARPDKPMVLGSSDGPVASGLSSQRLYMACCTMNANRFRTGSGQSDATQLGLRSGILERCDWGLTGGRSPSACSRWFWPLCWARWRALWRARGQGRWRRWRGWYLRLFWRWRWSCGNGILRG